MVSRKALIIGYPGEIGDENYCEGVFVDLNNYKKYLTSPLGGSWFEDEIVILLNTEIEILDYYLDKIKNIDYTFIAFSGHGYIVKKGSNYINYLQINKSEEICINYLKKFDKKRTIVLDCCREIYDSQGKKLIVESRLKRIQKAGFEINPNLCRKLFDYRLSLCKNGLIILHSCRPGQKSGDDDINGGVYTSSLLEAVDDWFEETLQTEYNPKKVMSVVKAHQYSIDIIDFKLQFKNVIQNPYIEKPRSPLYFPFGVIA